jgi:hypothetical protein
MKTTFRPPGQSTPLSRGEKAYLARLAKDAWAQLDRAGAIDQPESEWRRDQAIAAIGKRISEAVRGDFAALKTHFLAMAGKTRRAFDTALADTTAAQSRATALYHLKAELTKHQLDSSYAAAILADKYKTTTNDATAKQLWTIVYDVRRNMRRR